ncbi:MAG TPA: hypothetical protein VFY81_08475 [Gammaproteobacteria bacterium]|nr:hypothetical protein [Gammaproteobacteria bacterium]
MNTQIATAAEEQSGAAEGSGTTSEQLVATVETLQGVLLQFKTGGSRN